MTRNEFAKKWAQIAVPMSSTQNTVDAFTREILNELTTVEDENINRKYVGWVWCEERPGFRSVWWAILGPSRDPVKETHFSSPCSAVEFIEEATGYPCQQELTPAGIRLWIK